jgi:DNA polymerase
MGMNESELYRLLNLAEDYVLDGFRHDHPPLVHKAGAEPDPGQAPEYPESPAPPQQTLDLVARQVARCTACALHRERRQTVPGEGTVDPLVVVIGEGPGAEEDRSGRPFVGRAGQYLDRWLEAIGLDRKTNCFIGNIVKCRPSGNRDPLPEEAAACLPYLKRQLTILKPRAILTVGRIAIQILCSRSEGIGQLRGKELEYLGIPVVATYHPGAVLRNTDLRSAVWQDLKRLRALPPLAESLGGSTSTP